MNVRQYLSADAGCFCERFWEPVRSWAIDGADANLPYGRHLQTVEGSGGPDRTPGKRRITSTRGHMLGTLIIVFALIEVAFFKHKLHYYSG